MMDLFRYDFGYDWPWTYGHALAGTVFALAAWAAWRTRAVWWCAGLGALAVWAFASAVVVNAVMGFSVPIPLPTDRFLPGGDVTVLDAGAGSGRSTLMVLLSRPRARVTALDIFATTYGISDNTEARLRANARAAGAEDRLDVTTGDMREMPFEAASFDGAVSAFAIDHLNRADRQRTYAEMRRVIRPGGEFLLLVINNDRWIRGVFPFLAHHGYFGPQTAAERWRTELTDAGFALVEDGTVPGTLYYLARTSGPQVAGGQ
ncbi:MAG: class I SAM-dependent methyltransferase [Vicinamibacterales bacterium]